MVGHIERVCEHVGLIRIGGGPGEPWTWAGVLAYRTPAEVEVKAVERAPTEHEWRDAVTVMRDSGIEWFSFQRKSGATRATHVWSTTKGHSIMAKRVHMSLNITATMTDAATGETMATFGLPCEYRDVPYADALDVQESFMQAIGEHGARMSAKGRAHAAKVGK